MATPDGTDKSSAAPTPRERTMTAHLLIDGYDSDSSDCNDGNDGNDGNGGIDSESSDSSDSSACNESNETRSTMSCRSETRCDCHAGTATCTPSTNLTSVHHMLFEYAAIGGVSSASGFAPRSTRSTYTRVVRALCGASLIDPITSCSRQYQPLVPHSNRARRLFLSLRVSIALTLSGHLTSQLPRARLV